MAPPVQRLPRDPREPTRTAEFVVVAIPTLVALVLGALCVMPSVFASATTASAESVWAGTRTVTRPATTPTVPSAAPTPSVQAPTQTVAPAAAVSKPATTTRTSKPATTTPTSKPATTTTKAAPAKTTAKKPPSTASAAGPFVVTVNTDGGQAEIDACNGPILWQHMLIAQHAKCGGTRFYPLVVGSLVTLAGSAITPGIYRVTSIAETFTGDTTYALPHPYALQTCLTLTDTRLWYLQPV
jgi:hypothetical protein